MISSSIKNLMQDIKKEKLLSLSNFFVMIVTFLILGIFINIIVFSQTALRTLEQQAQITIFFKDDFTEASIKDVETKLKADTRILNVKYVSKKEAFQIFSDMHKDQPDLLASISEQILPASLQIRTKDVANLSPIASEYANATGVEEIRFYKDVVDKFKYWSTMIYITGFVLLTIFFVISYSVIISTLRTTINSKGTEFEIMKLVGASDKYVKSPLVLHGVVFGGVSGALSGIVMAVLVVVAKFSGVFPQGLSLGFLPNFTINHFVYAGVLLVILTLSGVGLGYLGSATAIKKYLKY